MLEARERCDVKLGCFANFCVGSSFAINGVLFGRVSERGDMPGIEHNQENRTAQQQVEVCRSRARAIATGATAKMKYVNTANLGLR
jgi:hypothetical protein